MKKKTPKEKIINALEENTEKFLNIEIKRSSYVKDRWNIRIGDIAGATELSNITLTEILKEIEDEMRTL